ncbi:hypothetical protein B0H16DRAFT_1273614, partial [Mycena metata]
IGDDWKAVVGLWWMLEEFTGFSSQTTPLPTTARPEAVKIWVKNARKTAPAIKSVEKMEQEWWGWWTAVNPEWRVREGELAREGTGSWDDILSYPGLNGMLNVVICLKWWYGAMDSPSDSWQRALSDVKWALEQM